MQALQVPTVQVKSRASSYIYLPPIPSKERTIYIAIKNDANSDFFDLQPWLKQSLQEKEFRIVNNIDEANIVLRANLFRVEKLNDNDVATVLNSEFGNSTPLLTPEIIASGSEKEAIIVDLQYFSRKNFIDPAHTQARPSMDRLNDIQLLLICNSARWERYQTRIIAIASRLSFSADEMFTAMGKSISTANNDIIRGMS